jgi:HK97 family phage portal protein
MKLGILKRLAQALNPVPIMNNGWRRILEPFAGAWQRNIEEKHGDLLCYPALYACINRLCTDYGKLPYLLKQEGSDGIWCAVKNPAYSPVLRKPNGFQTAQQFRESWLLSKLIQGNTYVLKRRDDRGVVTELYVLDPCKVMPMVSESGNVYYQLMTDALNTLPDGYPAENLLVPAREIIHDRCITPHHPLVGVPPLCAAYWPAVKNLKMLKSSAQFFANSAQPGGILTAPAGMSDKDAEAVKAFWDANYTGENAGKIAVIGADMKFTSFAMKGADYELVEQMKYSDEQICQPFGIPPFIVGIGTIPAGLKADDMAVIYHKFALQTHIEAGENLLDDGLGLSTDICVEMDLFPLLRMDQQKMAQVEAELVKGTIKSPNEARKMFDLAPMPGGDSLYLQQQNYSLEALAKRDARDDPFAKGGSTPEPEPTPEPDDDAEEMAFINSIQRSIEEEIGAFSTAVESAELIGTTSLSRVRAMAKSLA